MTGGGLLFLTAFGEAETAGGRLRTTVGLIAVGIPELWPEERGVGEGCVCVCVCMCEYGGGGGGGGGGGEVRDEVVRGLLEIVSS